MALKPQPKRIALTPAEIAEMQRAIRTYGVRAVAVELGVTRGTAASAAAGAVVRRDLVERIQSKLREPTEGA